MFPLHRYRIFRFFGQGTWRGVTILGCVILIAASFLFAGDTSRATIDAQGGWIQLFDGKTLFGWTSGGGGQWRVVNDTITADSGDSGYLRTNTVFADFILHCDFRLHTEGESGIILRSDTKGNPAGSGYKLQINNRDTSFPTGSLAGYLKAAKAQAAPGAWHTFEVEVTGDHFRVKLDGTQAVDGNAHRSKLGAIALQFVKGNPVEFRNIQLKPLSLQPIFNGQNLFGWKIVNPTGANAEKRGKISSMLMGQSGPDWAVENGAIHVKKGPSQLENGSLYDDFILQLAIRANGKGRHPQGGVLFRGQQGDFSTGYRVQVDNTFPGKDRDKPSHYGSGGLFGIQPARRVVSDDDRYFFETLVVRSHHISVWVNGFPVSDFEDTRTEGPDALLQSRNGAGTISLLSADDHSSLDFNDIRAIGLSRAGVTAGTPAPEAIPGGAPGTAAAGIHQKEIADLIDRAVHSSDPQEQVTLYSRILELDPNNMVAYNGRKDAQDKLDALQAQQSQRQQKQQQELTLSQQNEAVKREALQQAETAFLSYDIRAARSHLNIAKKIDPSDPEVQGLDGLIARQETLRLIKIVAVIALGILVLVGVVLIFLRQRGPKQPYLEIIDGPEKGKRYLINQEVLHLGAVAQEGANHNEVVISDPLRSVSAFHCEVRQHEDRLYVLDCDSANGTFLNGRRIHPRQPVLLKKGARLRLAEGCTLRLVFSPIKKTS
ncbi:MAG TPA: family 16 glycoside hydrolase [Candidatus Acidoferrum sp.]|nr:family 16 glycoside hydrolase [Candidatus Acidoferrum sp.]